MRIFSGSSSSFPLASGEEEGCDVTGRVTAVDPSYEAIFARWVSTVQCDSGTRQRAAAAVWRAVNGTGCCVGVDVDVGLLVEGDEDVGVYFGREMEVVKKVELRVTKSCAVV